MADSLLVRLPNWLGDALMARPMLHALRTASPSREVVAIGPKPLTALLEAEGLWDRALDPGTPSWPRCDVAVLAPPSFSSAWRAFRSGTPRRIGFRGDARDLLLTDALPRVRRGDLHLSREYLALADRAGAPEVPLPGLPVGEASGEASDAPFAVLAPGAIYGPAKRWPVSRFAETGRGLAERGLALRVCGSAADVELCRRVAEAIPSALMLAGTTSLAQQASICARAALVVSNDSGLAHLAAAVGTPTLVVFGSTSSAWTAPLGPRVRVVQRAPVCAPCFQRTCSIGTLCLERVEVKHVLDSADELLAAARAAA